MKITAFKPTDVPRQSPGLSQVDDAPFSPIYPFILLFLSLQVLNLSLRRRVRMSFDDGNLKVHRVANLYNTELTEDSVS